jgi:ribosomal protein S18 acetylase RimI-like enzyme
MAEIRRLSASEVRQYVSELAGVLLDCVEGGASVSFMLPFALADGEEFFSKVAAGVDAGERILLAAFAGGAVVGTVQVLTAMPPNQPHRGEISKLLVRRSARGRGIARRLMEEAERQAASAGKTLLVLDTASDHAERLYENLGWVKVGVIPKFALFPDGTWTDTTIFWKWLASERLMDE